MDRYVVIGNPVRHSKSPVIHARFADQTGQELVYTTLLAQTGEFPATVKRFFAEGGKGANVTVPFKEDAWALCERLTPEAEAAGAVNTLYLDDAGILCGHNTDGIGLVRDIRDNHGGSLKEKRILILGAGGATRGILLPFLGQQPAGITLANRTVARAEALADRFRPHGDLVATGFADLAGRSFDWVVNATSASLEDQVPDLPAGVITPTTWCYDLMYGDKPTAFCLWAKQQGAGKVVDGLGMLVEQAAESFYCWRGVRPVTGDVIKALRSG